MPTFADLVVLTKVRVNALVVATTAGGYYMVAPAVIDWTTLILTCVFTAMVASGAAAINQVDERDTDRLMERTRQRPIAASRMTPAAGRLIAGALSAAGLAGLWLVTNLEATLVALVTLVTYALVYTPLKRRSSLATVVGAVPGALPPLIGWAAAGGSLATLAPWSLFGFMFLWQLPHFLAIAWIYRNDYARAGLPMLPVIDAEGAMTGRQATLWAITIVPVSELPFLVGLTAGAYAIGALVLGVAQLALTIRFALRRTLGTARALFYGSITYLPLLWLLMALTRVDGRH
jgi:protoheme IX farnesyltransferase